MRTGGVLMLVVLGSWPRYSWLYVLRPFKEIAKQLGWNNFIMFSILTSLLATTSQGAPANFWLPKQASTVAESVDLTFFVITWICYFFFFAITGSMASIYD